MRVCRRSEVIDVHRTSRLDNFTSANQVFPGIARNWHQARDGMAAVSDLDRFPAATSSRYLLACCRNSRTPIVFMCYMVAHVITGQPPLRFAIPDKRPLPRLRFPRLRLDY